MINAQFAGVGHRKVQCQRHADPTKAWPIRVAAHAFGDNRPEWDLYLSPGHAICVDVLGEVLIPAGALTNGSTVTQLQVEQVTYWHVELDGHDILLANNLPAESYLAMSNRRFFQEADLVDLGAAPDPERTHADFCRPFCASGPTVAAVRAQLTARAQARGAEFGEMPAEGIQAARDGDVWRSSIHGRIRYAGQARRACGYSPAQATSA